MLAANTPVDTEAISHPYQPLLRAADLPVSVYQPPAELFVSDCLFCIQCHIVYISRNSYRSRSLCDGYIPRQTRYHIITSRNCEEVMLSQASICHSFRGVHHEISHMVGITRLWIILTLLLDTPHPHLLS